MKNKNLSKKVMVALAMMLMFVMGADAQSIGQQRRMMAFQTLMATNDTNYKNFTKEGKYKEAIATLTTLVNILDTTTICQDTEISPEMLKAAKADYLYDQACCYALTKQKKLALAALVRSIDCGYKRYDNMLNDNDLVSLRKDKKYQALLAEVKDRQPLSVLKKSAPYDKDAVKIDNPFRYEPKIINLLHFAHDNMPHDGSHRAFAEMDAIDLYNYCKTTGKGINCRQLAIALCEMYLSMGIPARYVTCMPADSLDYECHVINTVWSSQLQKWLWIDPTMDAWVTDENGTMLSIAEVRERLINDQPLVLCETANWNHQNKQTKENYLEYYMAKNLYYFVCKKFNRFNPESDYRPNPAEEDIRLIPVGFVNDNWKCDTTTDPDFFWAKPNTKQTEAKILFEIRPEVNYITHLYTLAGLGFSDEEYAAKYGNTLPQAAIDTLQKYKDYLVFGQGEGGFLAGPFFFMISAETFADSESLQKVIDKFNAMAKGYNSPDSIMNMANAIAKVYVDNYDNYLRDVYPQAKADMEERQTQLNKRLKDNAFVKDWERVTGYTWHRGDYHWLLYRAGKNGPSYNNLNDAIDLRALEWLRESGLLV